VSLRTSAPLPFSVLLCLWCSCTDAQRASGVYRCAPGFYLAKPYAAGNAGLTGCTSDLFNAHDLGDNEGRVSCVSTGGAMHDYTFNSTCIACPAGKFRATGGTVRPVPRLRSRHTELKTSCGTSVLLRPHLRHELALLLFCAS